MDSSGGLFAAVRIGIGPVVEHNPKQIGAPAGVDAGPDGSAEGAAGATCGAPPAFRIAVERWVVERRHELAVCFQVCGENAREPLGALLVEVGNLGSRFRGQSVTSPGARRRAVAAGAPLTCVFVVRPQGLEP